MVDIILLIILCILIVVLATSVAILIHKNARLTKTIAGLSLELDAARHYRSATPARLPVTRQELLTSSPPSIPHTSPLNRSLTLSQSDTSIPPSRHGSYLDPSHTTTTKGSRARSRARSRRGTTAPNMTRSPSSRTDYGPTASLQASSGGSTAARRRRAPTAPDPGPLARHSGPVPPPVGAPPVTAAAAESETLRPRREAPTLRRSGHT